MLLEVDNLVTHFDLGEGKVARAVDGVSFGIEPGQTLAVVGESGCGKSQTAFSIMRLLEPNGYHDPSSRILLEGEDLLRKDEEALQRIRGNQIAMIFQEPMASLNPLYRVRSQLSEPLRQHQGLSRRESRARCVELLRHVGIPAPDSRIDNYPHEMSGGMKQRIVIATALFLKPKLVILDEPTTALDVIVQAQIINLLKKLKKTFDLSFIFITHDLSLEAEISDRICVMYAGKIAELGTNQQIYGKQGPMHPYTEKLLQATPLLRKKVESLSYIPGTPPDLIDPPKGCRFHPRCHKVMDKCSQEEPPLLEIEPGHMVACWRCGK